MAVTNGTTEVRSAADASAQVLFRLRQGVLLPVSGRSGGFLSVLSPCQAKGWVAQGQVTLHAPATTAKPRSLQDATIVIDPGHGGSARGAVGRAGTSEEDVNLALARRLDELLGAPRDIDKRTGAVVAGKSHGVPRVFMTRQSDHDAQLGYRTEIANSLRAHALLSVHSNAAPEISSEKPGTEAYYQRRSPESKRLAGLANEEVVRSLTPLRAQWKAMRDAGAKWRTSARGQDYYAILRRSGVPAVILEVMFISNPPEETLLGQPEVQDSVAAAMYRALARYASTGDPGSGFVTPNPRTSAPDSGPGPKCVEPA